MMSSTAAANRSAPLPAPAVTDLLRIRELIYQSAGIFHADNKLGLLQDRCLKRMQVLGIATLREYHNCLTSRPMHQAELVSLLSEITIGETYFFRNRPQLDGIRDIILPQILEARTRLSLPRIRIWSAGCSTGEEPYSLAILLLEEARSKLKGWTFEVIATDLNDDSIGLAKAGCYGEHSVRNLNPYLLDKYFERKEGRYGVKPEVRQAVSFSRLNLSDGERMARVKDVDLILCCNVLIYFDAASRKKVIQQFCTSLLPHGFLFLGPAESLFGITRELQLVHLPSARAYVKSERPTADQTR